MFDMKTKNMKRSLGITMLVLLGMVVTAHATPYADNSNLEYWAIDGNPMNLQNMAKLVVDFGGGDHYAFGYAWESGSKTGWDMLAAVARASVFSETHESHSWGNLILSLSYDGHTMINSPWRDPPLSGDTSIAYWEGTDGDNWATAQLGVSTNPIVDGSWNAFTVCDAANWPGAPPLSAPEPATMSLLGLGGLALLRRRRRK